LVIEYLLGEVEIAASDISEIVGGLDNTNLIISISLIVLLTVVSKAWYNRRCLWSLDLVSHSTWVPFSRFCSYQLEMGGEISKGIC